jgi:hypothetical protein
LPKVIPRPSKRARVFTVLKALPGGDISDLQEASAVRTVPETRAVPVAPEGQVDPAIPAAPAVLVEDLEAVPVVPEAQAARAVPAETGDLSADIRFGTYSGYGESIMANFSAYIKHSRRSLIRLLSLFMILELVWQHL